MKANKEQQEFLKSALTYQCEKLNLTIAAICTIRDCWCLLCRHLNDISESKPIGFGNARDWKLADLNDLHIETAFKKILKDIGKTIE